MRRVAVITDSIACLPPEMLEHYRIQVLPIYLYFGEKVYRDSVDITPSEAYQLFQQDPERFTTSAPSPGDCMEAYRQASKQAEGILVVTISSRLSAVNQSALIAQEQAQKELPGTAIEVIDSYQATASEGFVALAGARAAEEGKSLPEVVKVAEEVRDNVSAVLFLDTIRYVYRSGRIPKVASQAGSVLNLKPILTVYKTVHFSGVVRSREAGIQRVLGAMQSRVGKSPVHVAVMHAYAPEEAEKLRERIAGEFNCAELWLSEFSPVMGYACGTGTVGAAFYTDD